MVKSNKDCIFCKIVMGEIKEKKVMESDSFIAVLDINPHTEGHTLVIPKQHYVTLLDLPNKLGNEMLEFSKKVASDLMDRKLGNGFNLIMNNLSAAGQVVMHAHIHILPRNDDDGIRLFTKV